MSAARFTRSGTLAAPVIVTKERTQLDGLRAVAVNSGNANAATGRPGLDEAAKMQGGAAMVASTTEDRVAVCSTGVIGVPLPGQQVLKGLLECSRGLSADGDAAFAEAIMTTDAFEKRCSLEIARRVMSLFMCRRRCPAISPRLAICPQALLTPICCLLIWMVRNCRRSALQVISCKSRITIGVSLPGAFKSTKFTLIGQTLHRRP